MKRYEQLSSEIELLAIDKKISLDKMLTTVCELLQSNIEHFDWVGFYFHDTQRPVLHLKAFAGDPTEHTEIPFGKGICGQVALSNKHFLVEDVTKQDNYIACSLTVKSELVVPLFVDNKNIGQIDIDSHKFKAFSKKDVAFLEEINRYVSQKIKS
ncbi:MAG: GAF domain-containing protein [Flavobacteriaceae bacterium]|nr:GAF domain-containing protein [Flavobacteriaceae bacterium]MDG2314168.1 GAF domain-containing protein [Flavobacteriaceae bacterium]